jgi:hypothetical protein
MKRKSPFKDEVAIWKSVIISKIPWITSTLDNHFFNCWKAFRWDGEDQTLQLQFQTKDMKKVQIEVHFPTESSGRPFCTVDDATSKVEVSRNSIRDHTTSVNETLSTIFGKLIFAEDDRRCK